ncbi:MAG: hypothetical protein PF541_05560 [Prolixibacteraceae bacterium]|jgi:hypothetical protein|nr:hypothetical protein [Prolixibacteraceae bacterium]
MDRITIKAYGEEVARSEDMPEEELQENRKVASFMYIFIEG